MFRIPIVAIVAVLLIAVVPLLIAVLPVAAAVTTADLTSASAVACDVPAPRSASFSSPVSLRAPPALR